MRVVTICGSVGALALLLSACDAGPSAVKTGSTGPAPAAQTASIDPRDAPVPMVNGKPMWAANRKHTAEENAAFQFGKNGKDFAAANEADYVAKVHAFVDNPPARLERIQRTNGDALLYDPKANVFAVVSRDGAPRTMFRPRDGAAYWKQQQDRQAQASTGKADDSQS
ncbi:MAG: hypothetical protein ACHP84_06855 [Caulobacterales bacterium]